MKPGPSEKVVLEVESELRVFLMWLENSYSKAAIGEALAEVARSYEGRR